jgi:hypothetical protein
MQLLMWATIGLGFGALTERAIKSSPRYPGENRVQAWLR